MMDDMACMKLMRKIIIGNCKKADNYANCYTITHEKILEKCSALTEFTNSSDGFISAVEKIRDCFRDCLFIDKFAYDSESYALYRVSFDNLRDAKWLM